MYHAGNLSLVLCLYGDTVATVSHGNHCVLQVGSGTAAYIGRKLAVDFIIGIFMVLRTCFSPALASSAISSSERIQRRISSDRGVKGAEVQRESKESPVSFSVSLRE